MIAFVPVVPEIEEQNGLLRLDFKSGEVVIPIAMTQHTLTAMVKRAHRILDEMYERQSHQIVEFSSGARRRK